MTDGAKLGKRAVVVGSGMGGLFAARVLSDHFDEVILLDRDHEPITADPRGTVPQGNHFHVLLPGGLDAMEEWFPDFVDDLTGTGSVEMQLGRDFYAYTTQGKSYSLQVHDPEPGDGPMTYVQTRPQLELNVRHRVASLPNVQLRYRALVEAPIVDVATDPSKVLGVALSDGEKISADLVVDASGRNSATARWLPAMGFDPAPETYVNCDVHYASVIVHPEHWDAFEGTVIFIMPSGAGEHAGRYGSVVKLPGDRWLVGLGGRYGDNAPADWDGFRAFGRTLIHPVWDELVETTTPITGIETYRMPRAVRHHYEQLDRFPDGLLPIADSVCFFNPTHGQGMSSAAGQCRGLATLLAERAGTGRGLDGLPVEFFPIAADWVRGPWILAAISDFEHPDCTGDFPDEALEDLMLLGQLAQQHDDPAAMALVLDIGTLVRPLSAVRQLAAPVT
jgi:2-polyprenyl-6-methoxyphenol hydroxylase-like FAD-dependent oxidoreductase